MKQFYGEVGMVEGKARKVERWNWTHIYHENERTGSFSRTYWEAIGNDIFTIDMTWLKLYISKIQFIQTFYVYLRAWWRVEHGRKLDIKKQIDYLNSKEDVMKA